jgi:uncharacterized membrane protein
VSALERDASVERTVMLTDAVVAIAMTLLVLPLVESVPDVDLNQVGAFVADHLSLFVSFVVSFLVILLFWAGHRRAFEHVRHMTPWLSTLNALWLLLIAFLPFPTALVGRGPTTSSAPIYIGTVFLLSAVSSTITLVASRASEDATMTQYLRRRALVGSASTAVLLVCTLVAAFNPDAGLWGLLAIVVIRSTGHRWSDRVIDGGAFANA